MDLSLQLLVRLGEFGGAFLNQRFQLFFSPGNFFLAPLAIGQVTRDFRKTEQVPGLVPHWRNHHLGPKPRPVLSDAPAFVFIAASRGRLLQSTLGPALSNVFGKVENGEVLSDDLFRPITVDPLGARIPSKYAAFSIQLENRVFCDAFHEQAKALLALPKSLLRLASDEISPCPLLRSARLSAMLWGAARVWRQSCSFSTEPANLSGSARNLRGPEASTLRWPRPDQWQPGFRHN